MADKPTEDQLSQYFAEMGKVGGKERAKRLSAKRRKEIATKASKAAAKARTRKKNSSKRND